MEKFNKNNLEDEFFEDSDIFKKADEELKNLVIKSNGKDENLTPVELERRKTLYQILRSHNKDFN